MNQNLRLHDGKMGSAIAVQVNSEAPEDEIIDILGDGTVQVRLACAADVESTNTALLRYLSKILSVPLAKIDIVAGHNSHNKIISIIDLNSDQTHKRVIKALDY